MSNSQKKGSTRNNEQQKLSNGPIKGARTAPPVYKPNTTPHDLQRKQVTPSPPAASVSMIAQPRPQRSTVQSNKRVSPHLSRSPYRSSGQSILQRSLAVLPGGGPIPGGPGGGGKKGDDEKKDQGKKEVGHQEGDVCAICMDADVNVRLMPCRHCLCAPCIGRIGLQQGPNQAMIVCPMCRTRAREYDFDVGEN